MKILWLVPLFAIAGFVLTGALKGFLRARREERLYREVRRRSLALGKRSGEVPPGREYAVYYRMSAILTHSENRRPEMALRVIEEVEEMLDAER